MDVEDVNVEKAGLEKLCSLRLEIHEREHSMKPGAMLVVLVPGHVHKELPAKPKMYENRSKERTDSRY